MESVVTDIQKSLRGESFNADHDTSKFSKSTQTTLKDLVEDMYSVCLGSEAKLTKAIEVTDAYCKLVSEQRVGISGGGKTATSNVVTRT